MGQCWKWDSKVTYVMCPRAPLRLCVITGHFHVLGDCISICSSLNVIQQASLCVQTRLSVLTFTSAVRPTIFQTVQRTQRRKTATLQVRLRVLCCVRAGIVECLKEWRCMVGGVEECGGRGKVCGGRGGGVWWEGWRSVVEGVRCMVRGAVVSVGGSEVCGREWRGVGGV